MTNRSVRTIVTTSPLPGSGILRPFPSPHLKHIDPFVFLDTGAPKQLGDGDIFVGPHAHRGVQPVSLLFRGRIEHRDSLGNHRTVESGGMQWLVAGSGALHEEVLHGDENGVFHMAQLWVNVPAAVKMDPPEHHATGADAIPTITELGTNATVRLYAGTMKAHTGPAPLPTDVQVAHVMLEPNGELTVDVKPGWNAAYTVVAGAIDGPDGPLGPGATPVFEDDGATLSMTSQTGGEVLLMCGEPIGEPIATGGGFVMNTPDEIERAFTDYTSGAMGTLASSR